MTDETTKEQPGDAWTTRMGQGEDRLRELHGLYLTFMTELNRSCGTDRPLHDYPEFCRQWMRLDPAKRASCESDYRKGFGAVGAEAEAQVAEVLRKHEDDERSAGHTGGRGV